MRGLWMLAGAGIAGALGLSVALGSSRAEREETYQKLAVFARVLNHVQTTYARKTDPTALIYAAIRGLVAELDPRSEFLTPEELEALRVEARRLHFDLGFAWQVAEDAVRVTAVTPGSAAHRRGVVPGHRLAEIDGAPPPLERSAVEDALLEIAEEAKHLTFVDSDGRTTEVRLRFAELRRPTVETNRRADGIVHLRIHRFTEDTVVEVGRALDAARPVAGLVLDLRGNTGGVVEAAARVADRWLESGVIATTEARERVLEKFVAHPYGTEAGYPLAILVDEETASAAELVALALHDAGRGVVVGRTTFGKGTVQTVIELEDGAALRLTVSRWFSASHGTVEGGGLRPDVPAEGDLAVEAAVRVARGQGP